MRLRVSGYSALHCYTPYVSSVPGRTHFQRYCNYTRGMIRFSQFSPIYGVGNTDIGTLPKTYYRYMDPSTPPDTSSTPAVPGYSCLLGIRAWTQTLQWIDNIAYFVQNQQSRDRSFVAILRSIAKTVHMTTCRRILT